jgi:hypothetical protein
MHYRVPFILISSAAAVLAFAACASHPEGRTARDCLLAAADSAFLGTAPLYRDCAVDRPAEAVRTPLSVTPNIRPAGAATCFRAEVMFVVGPDGRPEPGTIKLVRSSGGSSFTEAVLASVPGWTYSPAMLDGQAVRQLVTERRAAAVTRVVSSAQGGSTRPPRRSNC